MVRNKTHEAVKKELELEIAKVEKLTIRNEKLQTEILALTRIKTAVQETDRQNAKLRKEVQKLRNGK